MKVMNAFSINMLPDDFSGEIRFTRLASADEAQEWIGNCVGHDSDYPESAIGHADTAAIVSALLDRELPMNRVSVKLALYERALLAQYVGPRLPEGSTTLPEGARIDFYVIQLLLKRDDDKIREEYGPSLKALRGFQGMSPAELRALADEREKTSAEAACEARFTEGDDYGGSGFGRNIGND